MYDLIIIGGGPAGLTATIYALRKRLNVLLITKDLGGKTNYRLQVPDIEHHLVITGEEVVNRFVNEIEYLDFARLIDKVTRVERGAGDVYHVTLGSGQVREARAVILASGANAQKLNVPGEKDFLMRGLCYSAVSYAPLFIDRTCVVVGAGGLALRAAAELARIARQVTLVAPEEGELHGPLGRSLAATANVIILQGYQVERVLGDEYARILVARSGSEVRELHADAFFVELGLEPNTDLVKGLVALDAQGRVEIDARNRTSSPGLFAAGDVTDAFAEQVLIAIGEGAKAALSAYEYLLEQPAPVAVDTSGDWR